jgi:hypothetical protein
MGHNVTDGHEEGNRYAVGVKTKPISAGIRSYIILGGASKCSPWDTHSVYPHKPDVRSQSMWPLKVQRIHRMLRSEAVLTAVQGVGTPRENCG